MSYGQPYGYGPPPGQYPPPNQQWGGPPPPQHPHSPYPPQHGGPSPYPPQQGHSPYPPQQGHSPYPPQPGHHSPYPPQQGYPPPQQPYPPQNQGYQPPPYPPQGPPPGQYGQGPPPGQYGQYQQPPYGGGPPPQGGQYGPPPGPPPGQYGGSQQPYSQGAPPSPGYIAGQVAPVDTTRDADGLRAAMRGSGTDEKQLIQILVHIPDPMIMANLRRTYHQRFGRDLLQEVHDETSGYFREGLEAIIRGPLDQDVFLLHDNNANTSSDYKLIMDVLLGRSNADIFAIKQEYERQHRRPLISQINSALDGKTEKLFDMVLSGTRNEESSPVIPQDVDRAVEGLQHAIHKKDALAIGQIFSKHSDGQLRAIAQAYNSRNKHTLAHDVEKETKDNMEKALLRMLAVAEDRAKADADDLEATVKGAGTKDRLMINRIVRFHWNRQQWQQVRAAYKHFHKKELAERVHKETSGDYRRLAVALCELP